jgi:hypothetical protein
MSPKPRKNSKKLLPTMDPEATTSTHNNHPDAAAPTTTAPDDGKLTIQSDASKEVMT